MDNPVIVDDDPSPSLNSTVSGPPVSSPTTAEQPPPSHCRASPTRVGCAHRHALVLGREGDGLAADDACAAGDAHDRHRRTKLRSAFRPSSRRRGCGSSRRPCARAPVACCDALRDSGGGGPRVGLRHAHGNRRGADHRAPKTAPCSTGWCSASWGARRAWTYAGRPRRDGRDGRLLRGAVREARRARRAPARRADRVPGGADGRRLDDDSIASHMIMLLVGGTDTFPKVFANLALRLFQHPDQRARVAADPDLAPAPSTRACASTCRPSSWVAR